MIVPLQIIMNFVGEENSQILESTHAGVEAEVKNDFMRWNPESVTHTGKLYDGTGFKELFLDEMHIQSVSRVAVVLEDAIGIKNTSASSGAYVTVTSTGIQLVVPDGTNEDDATTLFADYATITLMIAQLNTIGKGWTVTAPNSSFGSYNSNTILPVDGFYVGAFGGNTAQEDFLSIAGEPIRFKIDKESGILIGGFPRGIQNIAINYISGWAAGDMPIDLQEGIKRVVKLRVDRDAAGTTGLKSYNADGVSETFDTGGSSSSSSGAAADIDALIPSIYRKIL